MRARVCLSVYMGGIIMVCRSAAVTVCGVSMCVCVSQCYSVCACECVCVSVSAGVCRVSVPCVPVFEQNTEYFIHPITECQRLAHTVKEHHGKTETVPTTCRYHLELN